MPKIKFLPNDQNFDVASGTKILASAIQNKVPIRFGCGACRCGTCAVEIVSDLAGVEKMDLEETALLENMNLKTDGTHRLACKTKVRAEDTVVDLSFQSRYSPDRGLFETD